MPPLSEMNVLLRRAFEAEVERNEAEAEVERLREALTRYDDAVALCAASGPTTEEWNTIKDAYLRSPTRKEKA